MNERKHYLAHYGVLGMHWGIRRYQPYPKGSGKNGRFVGAVSAGAKKAGSAVKGAVKSAALNAKSKHDAEVARNKAAKAEAQRIRNEASAAGMSEKKYKAYLANKEKAHKIAVDSHDPRVVQKNMHLLTDAEIDAKLSRLQKEAKIRTIAKQMPPTKKEEIINKVGKVTEKVVVDNILVPVAKDTIHPFASKQLGKGLKKADSAIDEAISNDEGNQNESSVAENVASSIAAASGKNPKTAKRVAGKIVEYVEKQ